MSLAKKKNITALSLRQPLQIINQCKGYRMLYSIKIVLPQFFLIVRRARPKSVKRPTFHWANLLGIKLDGINKATALHHSRSINHQNCVRDLHFLKLISCNGLRRKTCRCIFGHQTWQKFSKTTNRNIDKPSHGFDDWCLVNDIIQ